MKTSVYIGESCRSAYERGLEHLDIYTSPNSKSHMLRHVVQAHQHMSVKEVRWGLFKTEYKRTAFKRQIIEAVRIIETASKKKILNSCSGWNQRAPNLVSKVGNKMN